MDIKKKELYEVFADSLEKSRTKKGGLLFDKLFEDMWEHIEPKLGQSLPVDSVSNSEVALKAFVEEFVEAWEDGMGGDTDLYKKAKSLL